MRTRWKLKVQPVRSSWNNICQSCVISYPIIGGGWCHLGWWKLTREKQQQTLVKLYTYLDTPKTFFKHIFPNDTCIIVESLSKSQLGRLEPLSIPKEQFSTTLIFSMPSWPRLDRSHVPGGTLVVPIHHCSLAEKDSIDRCEREHVIHPGKST